MFIQGLRAQGGLPPETRLDSWAAFITGKTMPGQTVPDLCPLCHVSVTLLCHSSGVSVKKWHRTFDTGSEQAGISWKGHSTVLIPHRGANGGVGWGQGVLVVEGALPGKP